MLHYCSVRLCVWCVYPKDCAPFGRLVAHCVRWFVARLRSAFARCARRVFLRSPNGSLATTRPQRGWRPPLKRPAHSSGKKGTCLPNGLRSRETPTTRFARDSARPPCGGQGQVQPRFARRGRSRSRARLAIVAFSIRLLRRRHASPTQVIAKVKGACQCRFAPPPILARLTAPSADLKGESSPP